MRRRELLRVGVGGVTIGVAGPLGSPTVRATDGPGATSAPAGSSASATQSGDFEPLDRLDLPGAKELVVDDGVAYVAVTDGFVTVDVSDPADLEVLAEERDVLADHRDGPLQGIYDGKVGGDYYAVGGPANPAGLEIPHAAVVFDVSDPAAPEEVLVHETDYYHHNVDVDGETLYLCGNDADRNPLVCVDVESGAELGRWSVVDADERWADADHELRQLHDVRVEDGVAYCAYWNAGTWLVDVSDPTEPEPLVGLRGLDPEEQAEIDGTFDLERARFQLPGNDHFSVPQRGVGDSDLVAVGEEAWGDAPNAPESDLGGVEIWDVDAGERLARVEAPQTPDATPHGVWTTAHNFDFVGDRLYTSWYRGGLRVHDVSDPTDPVEYAHWRDDETTSFFTAQRGPDGVLATSWQDHSRDDSEHGAAVYAFPEPSEPDEPDESEGMGTGPGVLAGAAAIGVGAALARRWRESGSRR